MEKIILIKLPLRIRQSIEKPDTTNIIDSGNVNYPDCDECIKQAINLAIPAEKFCPNCPEPKEIKEGKEQNEGVEGKDYTLMKTYDYIPLNNIKNFFSLSKDTITILFYSGEVLSYKITEKQFLAKISKYITIV